MSFIENQYLILYIIALLKLQKLLTILTNIQNCFMFSIYLTFKLNAFDTAGLRP